MKFLCLITPFSIAIRSIFCTITVLKLLHWLRFILPWRVNCWFCNNNFWVKFTSRNSWTCQDCDQYNGFNKDGDYNKTIISMHDTHPKTPTVSGIPTNGLCRNCNLNQQLKVTRLANFVPLNERNYDEEVDAYRSRLEKALELCHSCKDVLQMKLNKEKEILLKLEIRSANKRQLEHHEQKQTVQNTIHKISKYLAILILILVSLECYKNIMDHEQLSIVLKSITQIMMSLFYTVLSKIKMMTFPAFEEFFQDLHILYQEMMSRNLAVIIESIHELNLLSQEALACVVCSIQIIEQVFSMNMISYSITLDLLWNIFVICSVMRHYLVYPMIMTFVKLISMIGVLLIYRTVKPKIKESPRTAKLINWLPDSDEDESIVLDDKLSLSKFGLQNRSHSSNDSFKSLNNSFTNRRSFALHDNSICSKHKLNSMSWVNPSRGPRSVLESVFGKTVYHGQQNSKDNDSDSDLDKSINSLSISSPKKKKGANAKKGSNSMFTLRQFNATPSFVMPNPSKRKLLISASRLGQGTSWVAGGYWGSGVRQLFSNDGSRSSSQSSGFESIASNGNQNNIFLPGREEPDSVEPGHTILNHCSRCSLNGLQNFAPRNSPVFPQMQYSVYMPLPRLAKYHDIVNQYEPSARRELPGRPGLIKLPEESPFTS